MDLYEQSFPLQDYYNVPHGIWAFLTRFGSIEITSRGLLDLQNIKLPLMETVEQRFYTKGSPNECQPGDPADEAIKLHSEKVKRLNLIADLVNNDPGNVALFKQAHNEITRLLYGREHKLPHTGPEFHPDLLKL